MTFKRWLASVAALGLAATPVVAKPLVAVIDSGVARTAELGSSVVAEYDMASTAPRPAFQPRYDHGTMVATILARESEQKVGLISIRIDDPAGCPPEDSPPCQPDPKPVERAIRKATSLDVDAINISLELAADPTIVDAIRDAAARGITVVLAAGNRGLDHPANLRMAESAYPRAVLVGALEPDGRPWAHSNRPSASNRKYVYVWQRGVDVPTTLANGTETTGTGTSFAVPAETARLLKLRRSAKRPGRIFG